MAPPDGVLLHSARVYLQTLLQYNRQTDTFSTNIRFGWLNTAGTGLFVVLNNLV